MHTEQQLLENLTNLSALDLRTLNRYYLHPRDQRCCSRCREIYSGIEENFHIKKRTSSGISWNVACASCFNETNRKRIAESRLSPEKFIRSKLSGLRNRARNINVPFDLTAEALLIQWSKQEGRCYYTGEDIDFTFVAPSGKHPHLWTPSLDRKTPALGYTVGNVVWCSYGINRMKNDLDEATFVATCRLVIQTIGNEHEL